MNKKNNNKQTSKIHLYKFFVNMSPKIKILAVLKTNVIIWSANHNIFYASNQHWIWKIVNSLSTFECMRTTKATNLNTMHVDSLKKSYQNHNAIKLTHIEHNRLFYPIVK